MPEWNQFRATLREFLQAPDIKKYFVQAQINLRTLYRWRDGETEVPDRRVLQNVLLALPQSQREQLREAVREAVPDFELALDTASPPSLLGEFPNDFWVRLLETHVNTPPSLHFSTLVDLMFLQLQEMIDPERAGILLVVSQCTPPHEGVIQSLREVATMRTHGSLFRGMGCFLGVESLSGYCVGRCQAVFIQNIEETWLPVRKAANIASVVAYPIQRAGKIAGCFAIASTQPYFFSQRLQYLLRIYSHFMTLLFDPDQFYAREQIRLCVMPDEIVQHRYLATFHERVLALLEQDRLLSLVQAEVAVWQQLEEMFVHHAQSSIPTQRDDKQKGFSDVNGPGK